MIRAMNSAEALKVAVDSHTGLGYDDCFRADARKGAVVLHVGEVYNGAERLS